MAILQRTANILPVEDLIYGLRHAASSVVRVVRFASDSSDPQSLSTGFFITPNIVVVPGYAVLSQGSSKSTIAKFHVEVADGQVPWQSEVVGAPEFLGYGLLAQAPKEAAVALLRLSNSAPSDRVLQLCFELPKEGDAVSLVHFPGGRPQTCVSFGEIKAADDVLVSYDADTLPGSSGAPVLDRSWRVVAMHTGTDPSRRLNQGLARAAFLKAMEASASWTEIASHHRLADDSAAQRKLTESGAVPPSATVDPILIRAAISPGLDRKSLSPDELSRLREHVVDPEGTRLVLRPTDRRNVITSVGSLKELRQYRKRSKKPNAAERVLNDILSGPPYHFKDGDEETLGWWIQASRWFAGVAPDLPTAAEVARELERQRVRGRLEKIGGPEFQGRHDELRRLEEWYKKGLGPLILTGIGGIGKSALIAKFASNLPAETLLLWLDFDRADLAPDNALSVLSVIAEQVNSQLQNFEVPKFSQTDWQEQARVLSDHLSKGVDPRYPPLLVLDSFEAAQYAQRYQELWPVLEQLSQAVTDLRVCVTGRAQVPGLKLCGKEAISIDLVGLEPVDARRWLRAKGISKPKVIDQTVELAHGIPLIIRLAVRFIETGGHVEDLPRDLPQKIVAGYLYDRILDRVQNPDFKELATGLLVLRRVTMEMITPVLEGLVTFPPGEPSEWFAELSREMALVEGSDVLEPRPEVRAATLTLLERDRPELVRKVDERAAQWYAGQATTLPEIAAELVYHRLRLGDLPGAKKAWRDGCGAFLAFAAEDIRDSAGRSWLLTRLGGAPESARPLDAWEQEASERIRSTRARNLDRVVGKILRERPDRSEHSPLAFHDAFELRAAGKSDEARTLLDTAGEVPGPIGRDRIALRALLAWEAGDRRAADGLLANIEDPSHWSDRGTSQLEPLAVTAARIRLAVDLDSEVKLIEQHSSPDEWSSVRHVLSPVDVLLPRLRQSLQGPSPKLERSPQYFNLEATINLVKILVSIDEERAINLPEEPDLLRSKRHSLLAEWSRTNSWTSTQLTPVDFGLYDARDACVPELAEFGWRRWWVAAEGRFLAPANQLCKARSDRLSSPLVPAIVGVLAIFALRLETLQIGDGKISLADAILNSSVAREPVRVRDEDWQKFKRILKTGVDPERDWDTYTLREGGDVTVGLDDLMRYRTSGQSSYDRGNPLLLALVAPDPLQQLVSVLAGQSAVGAFDQVV